ncbi:MAG: hypothetical protein IT158_11475 [Bryobacterales bacterium]|nr:hypothetical protein [Bryobacterales bacterium]
MNRFRTQAGFWKELMEHDRNDAYWQARNFRPNLKNTRPATEADFQKVTQRVYRSAQYPSSITIRVLE